mgnify:CR=1 FL=1
MANIISDETIEYVRNSCKTGITGVDTVQKHVSNKNNSVSD